MPRYDSCGATGPVGTRGFVYYKGEQVKGVNTTKLEEQTSIDAEMKKFEAMEKKLSTKKEPNDPFVVEDIYK